MRRWRNDYETNAGKAGTDHVDRPGGGTRKVDDAATHEGTAIGDAHVGDLAVIEVVHADPSIERPVAMGSGELLHVIDLAVGGASAVIGITVPTGDTALLLADPGSDRLDGLARAAAGCGNKARKQEKRERKATSQGQIRPPSPKNNSIAQRFFVKRERRDERRVVRCVFFA